MDPEGGGSHFDGISPQRQRHREFLTHFSEEPSISGLFGRFVLGSGPRGLKSARVGTAQQPPPPSSWFGPDGSCPEHHLMFAFWAGICITPILSQKRS